MNFLKQKLEETNFWIIPVLSLLAIGFKITDFVKNQSIEWLGPLVRIGVFTLIGIIFYIMLKLLSGKKWFTWIAFLVSAIIAGILDYNLLGHFKKSFFDPEQPANQIIPVTIIFYLIILTLIYFFVKYIIKGKTKRFYISTVIALLIFLGIGFVSYKKPDNIPDNTCPSINIYEIWYLGTNRVSYTKEQETWAKTNCPIFNKNTKTIPVDSINYWPDGDCPTEKQGDSYILHGKPAVLRPGQQEWINENCDGLTGYKKQTYPTDYPYQNIGSDELKTKAETALLNGVILADPLNDWMVTGNAEDNPNPYHISFIDIKSITFASDDHNLYVKIQNNGNWPKTLEEFPIFNKDKVTGGVVNISFDTDNNSQTGCPANGGAEVALGMGYDNKMFDGSMRDASYYMYGATGIDQPESARYRITDGEPLGRWGQPGDNYKILVYKLSDLGLTHGQKVTVSASGETGSLKYHHSSFDVFNPVGSTGDRFHKRIQMTI